MRAATILWAILAVAAGTSLFMLKYEVQAQEQRLSGLRKDIVEAQESIHVLRAEWSYLNDPSKLREQAERHLGLHPLKPNQIVTIASLPMNDARTVDAPAGQSEVQAAPVTVIPPAPQVARKAPGGPAKAAAPSTVPLPVKPPAKPARSMTAKNVAPAPAAKLASAKPASKPGAKPTAVATIKAAPVSGPGNGVVPPKAPGGASSGKSGDVMVIRSPAMSEPEVASTRVRP